MYRISRDCEAFTLIELLIVITVIIVLAGLLFPAFQGVQNQAKKTQAKNDEVQIVTAVNAYNTDYGKYPMEDVKQGFDTLYGDPNGTYGNEAVFNVLRAISAGVNSGDVLNPRKVVFFNGTNSKDATKPAAGFATQDAVGANGSPIKTGAFVDPWGNTYMIAIDGNYDGWTTDYLPYNDLNYTSISGNKAVNVTCFAASFGQDGTQGKANNKNFRGSDDVITWQ